MKRKAKPAPNSAEEVEPNRGGRPRKGGLIWRNEQWYARFSAEKDGEVIRFVRALGTDSKQVARAKLARMVKGDVPPEEAARCETFKEAAERYYGTQEEEGASGWKRELRRLEQHVFPLLGEKQVQKVKAKHINEVLESVRVQCKGSQESRMPSRGTLKHVLHSISAVLDDLVGKEVLPVNLASCARIPKRAKNNAKERAVLNDEELAEYLAFSYDDERAQIGLLQRQTMSCICRLFGGLRTGDLHLLRWESLGVTNGGFEEGYAPRAKSEKPQRLTIDEMLRPIIHRWWVQRGCPDEGLVFPALRDGKHSNAGEGQKHEVSHARAMRRDLRRAFGIDKLVPEVFKRSNGRRLPGYKWVESRKMTPRERELLQGTDNTLRVDFHSWRRAYCRALADANVNAQLARALAGHSTEAAHNMYLQRSELARKLPEEARPKMDLSKVQKTTKEVLATARSKT